MSGDMPEWKRYQENVAAVLNAAGLQASTDVSVGGARATHDVDVYGMLRIGALDVTWLAECKLMRRRVEKSHVLTFREVMQDVGGDLGLVLSESGF
ncbi:restriction endonuclease, partial [Actinomycetospora atypica]